MDIERRIRRLEDRVEIGELIARYGLVMDDRDIDGMPALFTPDVVIRSDDGVLDVTGLEGAVKMFCGRFAVLGPSNHVTHDRIITFDEGRVADYVGKGVTFMGVLTDVTLLNTALRKLAGRLKSPSSE